MARTTSEGGEIVLFPPLPRVPPPPPSEPDPRQRRSMRIIGQLSPPLAGQVQSKADSKLGTGYRASAVDIGRLKDAIERGLKAFTIGQVREREGEVFRWIHEVLRAWVQRRKTCAITIYEAGLRIEMQTQDDHGYYDYAFDVFPGRKTEHAAPRRRRT